MRIGISIIEFFTVALVARRGKMQKRKRQMPAPFLGRSPVARRVMETPAGHVLQPPLNGEAA